MSRRFLTAVLVAAAGGGTTLAQVSVSIPQFGTARAGAMARIEWIGIPEEADELELLLFLEGRDLPIRLTPQLDPRAGVLLWRVPNLPSRRARLMIRFDINDEEIESAPSGVFEILPSRDQPPAALVYHDGEWWAQGGSESPLAGLLGGGPPGGRVQEDRETPGCAGSSSAGPRSDRKEPLVAGAAQTRGAMLARQRAFQPRSPLDVPARI